MVSEDDDDSTAIRRNIKRALGQWGRSKRLLRRENANTFAMSTFYKVIVLSVLLYGSETWVVSDEWLEDETAELPSPLRSVCCKSTRLARRGWGLASSAQCGGLGRQHICFRSRRIFKRGKKRSCTLRGIDRSARKLQRARRSSPHTSVRMDVASSWLKVNVFRNFNCRSYFFKLTKALCRHETFPKT